MKHKSIIIFAFLYIILNSFSLAQDSSLVHETSSSVPELIEFHDVIYLIWHEAYPNKDYEALRGYVNEINEQASKVYDAQLPGILRDKEEKWKEGIVELKKAVDNYNTYAEGNDDEQLLNAAEILHSKFETMIRIIKPILKEVDEFHKVLYVIYHKYLPELDFDNIKLVSKDLHQKATAITGAKPTRRIESKIDQFKTASNELVISTNELIEACQSDDNNMIETAVENVHTKYQKLEGVFD
jgi:hypothetical protein